MKFLTLEQFTECWRLQDELNSVITPDWKEQNYNWNLYIKAEIMEFFEYIGYKHWKEPSKAKKPSDMQARLELVDIWHFLLSHIIQINVASTEVEFEELHKYISKQDENSLSGCLESIQKLDYSNVNNFTKVLFLTDGLQLCEWTWDELYKAYIGKVALNNFRQANGYKEGTYQKIWDIVNKNLDWTAERELDEVEDNYFLEVTMKKLERHGTLSYEFVYRDLQRLYNQLVLGKATPD